METVIINPGKWTLAQLRDVLNTDGLLELPKKYHKAIHQSHETVMNIVRQQQPVYGVNTGFGALANIMIAESELHQLQESVVLSHAVGTGELLSDNIVKLMMALKISNLAQGYSGVHLELIEALLTLCNAQIYPCIPSKGSVGASGDLAPLAHMAAALLGEGDVRIQGQIMPAKQGLAIAEVKPAILRPKEGLALLNGIQASAAIAIDNLFQAEILFISAIVAGCLSMEALAASSVPFDERIHQLMPYKGQQKVAQYVRELLQRPKAQLTPRVQDPYSLRCQPQVMGACYDQLYHAADNLLIAANSVSDNPLVFSDKKVILSGGNFHAESVAMAADNMALAIAEIGALSERRIALLVDEKFSGLPPFLVKNAGLNSGFMVVQVTAAALASENKSLAHPASVDSIPTSANQEDHVSMANYAARRLHSMNDNTKTIIAIELLAACQGIELRQPAFLSKPLQQVMQAVRARVPHYAHDRFFAPDIAAIKTWVGQGALLDIVGLKLFD
jgi:histidine ammonia-lyase